MSERSPKLLILDIIESGEKILRYTKNLNFSEFESDEILIDAVIRNFAIIGEAANRLPESTKEINSDIDWQRIRGFRNRIIHDYAGVDLTIVWNIITDFLPEILVKLREVIKGF